MGRGAAPHTDGVLIVDKPRGFTSHDVVAKLRGIVKQKRIGHAGTLDPDATGVLVVGLGKATKLMRFATDLEKSYVGEIVLGTTTSTLDNQGEVTATFEMDGVTLADVQRVAEKFVGDIEQVPPMVSAIKVDGKRLHELAREGIEIERQARPVTINTLDVDATDERGVFRISVKCSSGTYIRSLAADIGEALGGGAHLRNLRRTAIGPFAVEEAATLEALQEDWQAHLLPSAAMVSHFEAVEVDEAVALDVSHGKAIGVASLVLSSNGPYGLLSKQQQLLGVFERNGDALRSMVTIPQ